MGLVKLNPIEMQYFLTQLLMMEVEFGKKCGDFSCLNLKGERILVKRETK